MVWTYPENGRGQIEPPPKKKEKKRKGRPKTISMTGIREMMEEIGLTEEDWRGGENRRQEITGQN